MSAHRHTFVENYDGMVAFGLSRDVDEKTLIYYLQKFSDDDLAEVLVPRLTNEEMDGLFTLLSTLMQKHLTEDEYHRLFLKDGE